MESDEQGLYSVVLRFKTTPLAIRVNHDVLTSYYGGDMLICLGYIVDNSFVAATGNYNRVSCDKWSKRNGNYSIQYSNDSDVVISFHIYYSGAGETRYQNLNFGFAIYERGVYWAFHRENSYTTLHDIFSLNNSSRMFMLADGTCSSDVSSDVSIANINKVVFALGENYALIPIIPYLRINVGDESIMFEGALANEKRPYCLVGLSGDNVSVTPGGTYLINGEPHIANCNYMHVLV